MRGGVFGGLDKKKNLLYMTFWDHGLFKMGVGEGGFGVCHFEL